ncbi:MAG: hypothetical protein JXC32_13840 [Anaerolineae bacterium]|nr:hypothetical protein [Anaerolineae bacterium]
MSKSNVFEEPFEGTLREGWTFIAEAPEAVRVGDGVLHLRTLPGTLWGERNDAHNILIRPETEVVEGLTSEVTVTNAPVLQGEQAGMNWYVDKATYVKLVKENLGGTVWIVLAREENDVGTLVNRIPMTAGTVRLRLSLRDDTVVGESRAEGDTAWTTVGTCAPPPSTTVRPGIFSHGGPDDEERWAELSAFTSYVEEV